MVLKHITRHARLVKEVATTFNTDFFSDGDLYILDVFVVPKWLKDFIGKAEHENVLNGFFPEVVINTVNLVLGQPCHEGVIEVA